MVAHQCLLFFWSFCYESISTGYGSKPCHELKYYASAIFGLVSFFLQPIQVQLVRFMILWASSSSIKEVILDNINNNRSFQGSRASNSYLWVGIKNSIFQHSKNLVYWWFVVTLTFQIRHKRPSIQANLHTQFVIIFIFFQYIMTRFFHTVFDSFQLYKDVFLYIVAVLSYSICLQ